MTLRREVILSGMISPNEWCKREKLPPVGGGDEGVLARLAAPPPDPDPDPDPAPSAHPDKPGASRAFLLPPPEEPAE